MIKQEITAETIEQANSYVPLLKKAEFAKYAAQRCMIGLNVTADDGLGHERAMPSLNKVDPALRSRYLMSAFVKLYLRNGNFIPVENDEILMSQDEYDNYAGSHIFNEMNRLKSNNSIRNKVFDILSDFKELTAMFDAELNGMLYALNDPVARIYMAFTQMMNPEEVSQMLSDINTKKGEIEQFISEMNSNAEEQTEEPDAEEETAEEE